MKPGVIISMSFRVESILTFTNNAISFETTLGWASRNFEVLTVKGYLDKANLQI